MASKPTTYKNHRPGSRKGAVRKVFDEKGRDPAISYGRTRKLAVTTLRNWVNTWAREAKVGKVVRANAAVKKAKDTVKAPKAGSRGPKLLENLMPPVGSKAKKPVESVAASA